MTFQSIHPYDQTLIAEYEVMGDKAVHSALQKAEKAFGHWRKKTFAERALLLQKAAAIMREQKDALAQTISLEMGKVISEAQGEVQKCAWNCDYYAEHGEEMLREQIIASDAYRSYVRFDPIGAVFAIMPWNFPYWQVFRFAAPTLMAGNVVLLKHAPNVCGCALAIAEIFRQAGFPEGVFQTLIVEVDKTEAIIQSDIVQGVTLTGSEYAGSSVAAIAGKHIKKTVMELGGSDPLIVMEDADMERAAKISLLSRMQNAGQSCIAAKRFIILEKAFDEFTEQLIANAQLLRQGNPLEGGITTGPIARKDLAEKLQSQLDRSVQKGAKVLFGGNRDGCNFEPTLLAGVVPGMAAFEEETFGPMANLILARDVPHAIALANQNRYGLGATIWTRDLAKARQMAGEIHAGSVFVNALVKSDPRLPFGGIRKSGYGRELSEYGMKEFVNVKTVYMDE